VGSKDVLNVGLNSVALLSSIISASAVLNAYTTRRKSDEDRLAEHTPSGSALLVITFVVYFDNIGPFNLNNLARRQIYLNMLFAIAESISSRSTGAGTLEITPATLRN
jgi:hypothetical protein